MSHAATDLTAFIGRTGLLTVARLDIQVEVQITDARSAFGRLDLRVTPTAGEGSDWVARSNVTFPDDVPAPTDEPVARTWRRSK